MLTIVSSCHMDTKAYEISLASCILALWIAVTWTDHVKDLPALVSVIADSCRIDMPIAKAYQDGQPHLRTFLIWTAHETAYQDWTAMADSCNRIAYETRLSRLITATADSLSHKQPMERAYIWKRGRCFQFWPRLSMKQINRWKTGTYLPAATRAGQSIVCLCRKKINKTYENVFTEFKYVPLPLRCNDAPKITHTTVFTPPPHKNNNNSSEHRVVRQFILIHNHNIMPEIFFSYSSYKLRFSFFIYAILIWIL
jgi:hypothetical protein